MDCRVRTERGRRRRRVGGSRAYLARLQCGGVDELEHAPDVVADCQRAAKITTEQVIEPEVDEGQRREPASDGGSTLY